MHLEVHGDAEAFLDAASPLLLAHEAENNVVIASANLIASGDHPFSAPFFFATLSDGSGVTGAAIRTPPDSLFLTAMPDGAAALLVEAVAGDHPALPSVTGPAGPAHDFAEGWCRAYGGRAALRHHWNLYVLETLTPPARKAPGRLRAADDGDLERLREWGPRYAHEVNAPADVTAFLERMLRRGTLYVWDHGGARCLVAMSGRTPNGMRVAAVYTPDEYRNRGYATSAVAEITATMLARGFRFCMLVAETQDEAPNRIYRRLGFEVVAERIMLELGAAEDA